jgi:hypothetical protein
MDATFGLAAILRDAAKRPLLRIRAVSAGPLLSQLLATGVFQTTHKIPFKTL